MIGNTMHPDFTAYLKVTYLKVSYCLVSWNKLTILAYAKSFFIWQNSKC